MKFSDKLSTWFGGLSAREQRLLGILGTVMAFFVLFVFGYTIYSSFSEVGARIERANELSSILENNKEAIATKFASGNNKKERDPVPQLTSFLDDISKRKSVPVQNYGGEKSLPTKDKKFTETSMEVRLAKVTLQQIVDFLQEIENANEAAYTKILEINIPRKDQRDSFDVVMTVATYEDPNAPKKSESKDKTADAGDEEPGDPKEDTKDAAGTPTKLAPVGGYGTAKGSKADDSGDKNEISPVVPAVIPKTRPEAKKMIDESKLESPVSKGIMGRRPFPINKENVKEETPENK
jgi:hypothetical protein